MVKRYVSRTIYPTFDVQLIANTIINLPEPLDSGFAELIAKLGVEKFNLDSLTGAQMWELVKFFHKHHLPSFRHTLPLLLEIR